MSVSQIVLDQWFAACGESKGVVSKIQVQLAEDLLDKHKGRLDVNVADRFGHTALSRAVRFQHIELVSMLLRRGADVNKHHNNPLLRTACGQDNIDIVWQLISAGVKIDEKVDWDSNSTALHNAKSAAVVRVLLESGADAKACVQGGSTAFEQFVIQRRIEMVAAFNEVGDKKETKGISSCFVPSHERLFCRQKCTAACSGLVCCRGQPGQARLEAC